jgi:hypothetical protein
VLAAPRLCKLYSGICLTTEEKARKNLSYGSSTYITSTQYNTRTMNSTIHIRKAVTQSSTMTQNNTEHWMHNTENRSYQVSKPCVKLYKKNLSLILETFIKTCCKIQIWLKSDTLHEDPSMFHCFRWHIAIRAMLAAMLPKNVITLLRLLGKAFNTDWTFKAVGRDSSVGIATGYRLDGPGIES